jgi:ketosteroid isomerase-like protein
MNSPEILTHWLAAINGHDVIALSALMAPRFVFIGALANRVEGAGSLESAWRGLRNSEKATVVRARNPRYSNQKEIESCASFFSCSYS